MLRSTNFASTTNDAMSRNLNSLEIVWLKYGIGINYGSHHYSLSLLNVGLNLKRTFSFVASALAYLSIPKILSTNYDKASKDLTVANTDCFFKAEAISNQPYIPASIILHEFTEGICNITSMNNRTILENPDNDSRLCVSLGKGDPYVFNIYPLLLTTCENLKEVIDCIKGKFINDTATPSSSDSTYEPTDQMITGYLIFIAITTAGLTGLTGLGYLGVKLYDIIKEKYETFYSKLPQDKLKDQNDKTVEVSNLRRFSIMTINNNKVSESTNHNNITELAQIRLS